MTNAKHRPIRFGITGDVDSGPAAFLESARKAEKLGFSTFGVADHFMLPAAPLVALQAAADATTTLRLTMHMINQDLRHPAVLAKEFATLDAFSGGRVEIGIGAGWVKEEYEQAGIRYDKASVRIERLEEYVIVLKGLFAAEPFSFSGKHFTITDLDGTPKPVQNPRPPIMIGGGGRKLLSAAARQADIIQIVPSNAQAGDPAQFTAAAFEEKLSWIHDAAADRLDDIELGTALLGLIITDDREQGVAAVLEQVAGMHGGLGATFNLTEKDIIDSPAFAIGTLDQVCEKLLENKERYGFTYFTCGFSSMAEAFVPVIAQLEGK